MTQIEVHDPKQPSLPTAPATALSIPDMMQAVIAKDLTPESVGVMKELVALKRELDADEAKRAFNRAFIALKRDLKPIAALKAIPLKGGGVKSTFAPLADIKGEIDPLLDKHGFTDTYTQEPAEGGKTTVTCILIHEGGHERSAPFTCRLHQSPNNTDAQNDGGTSTLARRYALCLMLGLVFDYSQDARLEGDTITAEEAAALQERVGQLCCGDADQMARYLKLGGANAWTEIRRSKYEVVLAALEQADPAPSPAPAPAAAPATPFPASYDDAGAWRSAMLEHMATRWGCPAKAAAGAFDAILKASGVSSYVAVEVPRRKTAWESLTAGKLDKYAPAGAKP